MKHFMPCCMNPEKAAVKSVVVNLNARIIIDRFHIVQPVGTASSMISPTVRLKKQAAESRV